MRHGLTIHRWNETHGDDFDELAAEVASLDLVISVANATVHLAGAWASTPGR